MLAKFCPRTVWQRRIQQRYVAVHSLRNSVLLDTAYAAKLIC